jgi:hypothetical protein
VQQPRLWVMCGRAICRQKAGKVDFVCDPKLPYPERIVSTVAGYNGQ